MNMCSRQKFIAIGSIAIAALAIAMVTDYTPRIVWNASASAPTGFYRIDYRQPELGDYVLVFPSKTLSKFIDERQYLPSGTPLIKRIAALPGDKICRTNERILVNRIHVADALLEDSLGRIMPRWSGCFTLKTDEMFLLNAHEKSLDGRYFGATKRNEIIGVAIPVFVKE